MHASLVPWPLPASCAWQLAHVFVGLGACGEWQFSHVAWPIGALDASALWHVGHDGTGCSGACAALAWHVVHSAWPVPAVVLATAAWHFVHSSRPSLGFGPWPVWQSRHCAFACDALVWHDVHATFGTAAVRSSL